MMAIPSWIILISNYFVELWSIQLFRIDRYAIYADRFLNAALDMITESLKRGEKVQLSGFGTFEVKQRQARMGRNPKTREAVEIPPVRVPDFKPSQNLKEIVK